jgi:hypothetical protein
LAIPICLNRPPQKAQSDSGESAQGCDDWAEQADPDKSIPRHPPEAGRMLEAHAGSMKISVAGREDGEGDQADAYTHQGVANCVSHFILGV